MINIGILFEVIVDFVEELNYQKEGLFPERMNLGKYRIKIANSFDNIAGIYHKQQESEQALRSLKLFQNLQLRLNL